jgi:ElaB/YqjD/DUF883 family membrane-anchored ribosome-binding protein
MRALFLWITFVLFVTNGSAQQVSRADEQLRALQNEMATLRAHLDSLQKSQGNLSSEELEKTKEHFENRMRQLENKIDALARSMAPTALNPRTTAFVNFAARSDNKDVFDAEGVNAIDNRPFLRTVELDLRAPVDPYAEAITILALEDEAGTGFAVDVEEAYGVLKRLPLLEDAPWGLKLKIGKFRAPFGVNNKLHLHDVPWTTRPLVVSKYLGTEHGEFFESGFNPVGADFDFFLPNPIPSTTLEMNLSVVRSGELGLGQPLELRHPAYMGHLTFSRDWNNEHLLILGGSAYLERGDHAPALYGVDLTYKWSPVEQRQWNSVVVGGEFFSGKHSFLDADDGIAVNKPYGWFAYAQYQSSYWTYLGVRYDWLQEPNDVDLITKSWSAYVSYYTTEFLRLRLGFQRTMSDALVPELNNVNSILFEVNFVFGSHPTEPYWVNR